MSRFKIIFTVLSLLLTLAQADVAKGDQIPINLLPMYGAPSVLKTAEQIQIDQEFISNTTKSGISRDSAAVVLWSMGMKALIDRDRETAMKRFNQSWLLDPECFLAYWGFGKITYNPANAQEALEYYDKSLTLLQSKKERPSLKNIKQGFYYDIGRAYAFAAILDSLKAPAYCKKADDSFEKLYHENPKFAGGYDLWLINSMTIKNYRRAWEVVHAARLAGAKFISEELIKKLSEKMPEPKN